MRVIARAWDKQEGDNNIMKIEIKINQGVMCRIMTSLLQEKEHITKELGVHWETLVKEDEQKQLNFLKKFN